MGSHIEEIPEKRSMHTHRPILLLSLMSCLEAAPHFFYGNVGAQQPLAPYFMCWGPHQCSLVYLKTPTQVLSMETMGSPQPNFKIEVPPQWLIKPEAVINNEEGAM